jgi:hypothetical protein
MERQLAEFYRLCGGRRDDRLVPRPKGEGAGRCGACVYWQGPHREDEPLDEDEDALRGTCRRFPPWPHPDEPYRGLSIYPLTGESDGCGEYVPCSEDEFKQRCRHAAEILEWSEEDAF